MHNRISAFVRRIVHIRIGRKNNSCFRQILLNPYLYALIASNFYRIARKQLRILDGIDDEIRKGFEHNIVKRVWNIQFRPDKCFSIARCHDYQIRDSRLLIIGPRNFTELLLAWFHGFSWRNIVGVDLFSEFHKVRLGRVEDLPFPDNHFDIVVCSGVLNYVARLESALENLVRVTRKNGLVVIQTDYSLCGDIRAYDRSGSLSIDQKLSIIKDSIHRISFREDVASEDGSAFHQFAAFIVAGKID